MEIADGEIFIEYVANFNFIEPNLDQYIYQIHMYQNTNYVIYDYM